MPQKPPSIDIADDSPATPKTPKTPKTPSSLSRKIQSSLSNLRWTFRRKIAHGRRHSAGSHYDLKSYEQNFDDSIIRDEDSGLDDGSGPKFPPRSMSSRHPAPQESDKEEKSQVPLGCERNTTTTTARTPTTTTSEIVKVDGR